jgi:hypothetical protein
MGSNSNSVESHAEPSKSVNGTNHDGQAIHNKFTADVEYHFVNTLRSQGSSTAALPDLQLVDSSDATASSAMGGTGVATEAARCKPLTAVENDWSKLKAVAALAAAAEKKVLQVIQAVLQGAEHHPLKLAGEWLAGAVVIAGLTALAPEQAVAGLGLLGGGYVLSKMPEWTRDKTLDAQLNYFSNLANELTDSNSLDESICNLGFKSHPIELLEKQLAQVSHEDQKQPTHSF